MPTTMFDAIHVDQIPPDAANVAGYVNGTWPTYASLEALFPHASRLSITVTAAGDADCLDVEKGDAQPWQAPGWVKRQRERGLWRPMVYCSVSLVNLVLSHLASHGIARHDVRVWSAHYTQKAHICGPASCAYPGLEITCDGTQWTSHALGRDLDQSLISDTFFAPPPEPRPEDDDMAVSGQITTGKADIALADGMKNKIRFYCSVTSQISVDLRKQGVDNPALDLGYGSAHVVTVPSDIHAIVVHVTKPAADGTPVSYTAW